MQPIDKAKAVECLGDEAVFDTMIVAFLTETDEMMSVLAGAVAAGDREAIREKAHWVKGGLVYLHATPSAEAAKKLENAIDLGPAEVEKAHQELIAEISRLKVALNSNSH